MKANELIHGGLYLIHDTSDIIVRYDITSNSFRSEWREYHLTLFLNDVYAADDDRCIIVKPITLTSVILEKNGFKTNNDHTLTGSCIYRRLCGKWEEYEVAIRLLNGWIIIRSFDERWHDLLNVHFQPRYVHEFQHALMLGGLHDLAENFKV